MVAQPPLITLARQSQLRILAEPADFGTAYPNTVIAVHEDFLKAHRPTLRRFKMAIVEAIHAYKTQPSVAKKSIAKYMRISDPQALDDSYRFISGIIRSKRYPALDGIAEVLNELAQLDPKARTLQTDTFVDAKEIKERDESGFIGRLAHNPM